VRLWVEPTNASAVIFCQLKASLALAFVAEWFVDTDLAADGRPLRTFVHA